MKKKYQWANLELKQRAKRCELAVLVVALIGVIGLFVGQVMLLIGAMLIMGVIYIYMGDLRKKDRRLHLNAPRSKEVPYDIS